MSRKTFCTHLPIVFLFFFFFLKRKVNGVGLAYLFLPVFCFIVVCCWISAALFGCLVPVQFSSLGSLLTECFLLFFYHFVSSFISKTLSCLLSCRITFNVPRRVRPCLSLPLRDRFANLSIFKSNIVNETSVKILRKRITVERFIILLFI